MATFSKRGRRVTSVRGFVDATFKQPGKTKHFFAYRGHKSESYKLRPSIFRKVAHRKNERRLLQELMTSSADDFIHDKSTFDYLVRAQHFGLPTRLSRSQRSRLMGHQKGKSGSNWIASQSTAEHYFQRSSHRHVTSNRSFRPNRHYEKTSPS